jgi:hemerythrin
MQPEVVTARDVFFHDHSRLEHILDELVVGFEGDDAHASRALWRRFVRELGAHFAAEERLVLTTLARLGARDAGALLEEHRRIRGRVAQITEALRSPRLRRHLVRKLRQELLAHAHAEDEVMRKWANVDLSDDERALVMAELATARRHLHA